MTDRIVNGCGCYGQCLNTITDDRVKRQKRKLRSLAQSELGDKNLAVTYFHMGKPHTIIGAEQFHFRVREGIGWFPLAIAARQTRWIAGTDSIFLLRSVGDMKYRQEKLSLTPFSEFGKL